MDVDAAQLTLPVHGGGDLVQLQAGGEVPHRLVGTHNLPLLLTAGQLFHPALSHTCVHTGMCFKKYQSFGDR